MIQAEASLPNHNTLSKKASKIPNITPANTSRMWWRYSNKRDKLTLIAHAHNGGQNSNGNGASVVKNNKTKNARDAWPLGKLIIIT